MVEKVSVPTTELTWALSYDGYRRLASDPTALFDRLVRPMRDEFESAGSIPDWCGVDLLRGWLFFLQREDHHGGGWPPQLGAEWISVLYALFDHPHAGKKDRPVTIFGQRPRERGDNRPRYQPTSGRDVARAFDVAWRNTVVGTVSVSDQGLDYEERAFHGFARLIEDSFASSAEGEAAPQAAALTAMRLLASVPEVEVSSRRVSAQPPSIDANGGATLDGEAEYAIAFDPYDDEVIGLLGINPASIVFVRDAGRWVEPNSEYWIEKLDGFDTYAVTSEAIDLVDRKDGLVLNDFVRFATRGSGRL